MSRYSTPRVIIYWERDRHLQVLKMLAWVVKDRERVGVDGLWSRVGTLCEPVMQAVLGESGVTLGLIRERTRERCGADITPAKLMQRADKTERYDEFNVYVTAVENAYAAIVSSSLPSEVAAQA